MCVGGIRFAICRPYASTGKTPANRLRSSIRRGRLPSPTKLYVTTDGSATTDEIVRTSVIAVVPTAYVRLSTESRATSRVHDEFGRVVGLGLIGTLVLAGCSLAVAGSEQ